MRGTSRLPQYFISAMFIGALTRTLFVGMTAKSSGFVITVEVCLNASRKTAEICSKSVMKSIFVAASLFCHRCFVLRKGFIL